MNTEGLVGRLRRPRAVHQATLRRRGRRTLLRTKLLIGLLVLLLALGGGWLWLRDSPLVAVKRVTVSGASGPESAQIRSALIAAAHDMTTLHVRADQLRMAVSPYPIVKDLRITTQFPHGMRIRVIEQAPVGVLVIDGRTIPVSGDGTLLHDVGSSASLPTIPLRVPPGGSRLSDPSARNAVALLAAAPDTLRARVSQVTTLSGHGLVAQLRNGPSLYFGDADRLGAKWDAVAAVLADAGSPGALYIDVTDPGRPAAGASSATATGSSGTAAASSGTAAGSSGTAAGSSGTAAASGAASGGGATTSTSTVPAASTPGG